MKIHIHCPGSWSADLNSPSRGEGRWALNMVKMLAKAGHTVYATSGGVPFWLSDPIPNVILLNQAKSLLDYGMFDLHIDSAWWEDKDTPIAAKKNIVVKWSLEDYLKEKPLPKNYYLVFPYKVSEPNFFNDINPSRDRSFFMPTPLCEKFGEPKFNNKGVLWPSKDFEREKTERDNAAFILENVLYPLLEKESDLFIIWLMYNQLLKTSLDIRVREGRDIGCPESPYNVILDLVNRCKIAVQINHPGSVLECISSGVACLMWEDGGFFQNPAKKHNLLVERGATKERIRKIINTLLYNEKVYIDYIKDLQWVLRHHEEHVSLSIFNSIMEKIF